MCVCVCKPDGKNYYNKTRGSTSNNNNANNKMNGNENLLLLLAMIVLLVVSTNTMNTVFLLYNILTVTFIAVINKY